MHLPSCLPALQSYDENCRQPAIHPHEQLHHQSSPSIASDAAARSGVREAFSTLVRADVGQALGVSMEAVSIKGVSSTPVTEGGVTLDWERWPEWRTRSLDVSFFSSRRRRLAVVSSFL